MRDNNVFLKEKINEINLSLSQQCSDMYDLIGSVRDVFSSAYLTTAVADNSIVKELWEVLLSVFIYSDTYDNKFDAISVMSDINLYASRLNIELPLNELRVWRGKQEGCNISSEISECIDDILTQ